MKTSFFILIALLSIISSCSNAQNEGKDRVIQKGLSDTGFKRAEMKVTVQKVIKSLLNSDTTALATLFANYYYLQNKRDFFNSDCKEFKNVTKKYGLPSIDRITFSKDPDGTNLASMTILDKEDSTLNIKEFKLLVAFYPDQLLNDASKIINYVFVRKRIRNPSQKLIPLSPE